MSINPRYRELIERLYNVLEPTKQAVGQSAEPVSDELEDLLWLFAEDELSEEQESRLWELAAQEPAAVAYFQDIVKSLENQTYQAHEVLPLPAYVQEHLASTQKSPTTSNLPMAASLQQRLAGITQQVGALSHFIADIALEVAHDFLQAVPGTTSPLALSAARSTTERRTSLVQQLLKRIGILELTIDHAGNGQCHLTVQVIEPSNNYPVETLTAELNHSQLPCGEPQRWVGNVVRFADLAPGDYSMVFRQQDREIERINVALRAIPQT
ncbi:MAG: hypothetical protein JNL67_08920 [Planctomycetaceae bacterium]|nr:hypothetical protein [Planctomycetaceae bacterium]